VIPVVNKVNLALNANKIDDGVKESVLFGLVLHDGIEEIGVGFSMYGFDIRLNDKEQLDVKDIDFSTNCLIKFSTTIECLGSVRIDSFGSSRATRSWDCE